MTKKIKLQTLTGESQRLFHGRGKLFPEFEHLSIDFYPPHILVTTYKELSALQKIDLIEVLSEIKCQSILLQKRYRMNEPVEMLKGDLPLEAFAVESSEKYLLNLIQPQNIGFFLDMAVGRQWLRQVCAGKRVLNLFSYTCSLSVAAFKGGASSVVNMDMSQKALTVGAQNHTLNSIPREHALYLPHDIMRSFGTLVKRGPFDIVIIDPPTNQGDSFKVTCDYHKIIRRLNEMTSPGSIIMACLNSPFLTSSFLISAFTEHASQFQFQEILYSSFSEMERNKEEGLKIVLFKKIF